MMTNNSVRQAVRVALFSGAAAALTTMPALAADTLIHYMEIGRASCRERV